MSSFHLINNNDCVNRVGYLTTFDVYSLVMFATMFICCVIHYAMNKLIMISDKFPTRKFLIRLTDALSRVIMPNFVCFFYFVSFAMAYPSSDLIVVIIIVVGFSLMILPREYSGVKAAFIDAMKQIEVKVDDIDDLSVFEKFLFNVYTYRRFSSNLRHHFEKRAREQSQQQGRPSISFGRESSLYNCEFDVDNFDSQFTGVELNPIIKTM